MNGWQLLIVWTGLLVGVVAESLFDVSLFVLSFLGVCSFLAGLWWRRSGDVRSLTVGVCMLLVCVGLLRTQWYEMQFSDSQLVNQVGQRITLTGQVVSEPDERANFTQVYVATDSDKILVRADRFADVAYGDVVTISGRLAVPESFNTDTGRVFDYPKYLEARGVQYVMSFVAIETIDRNQGQPVLAFLYSGKAIFITALEQVIASPQVDLGVGLLLGVKQALGEELEAAFRQTGIIHIVVLSGYNVMLVVGFIWWTLSWFLPIRGRILFGLLGIGLFALLVGLSATVVRATIMASILLIGQWLGRLYDVLRALLFAAGVMVLINPYILLYDIGFQLSFMATLGLVLFLPRFETDLATHTSVIKLRDIFMATVVTQLFVSPLLLYHIGELSLVSVVVNTLVLPMVPVAMLTTFVAGIASLLFAPLGVLLGVIAQLPLLYIIYIANWFAAWPFAAVIVPPVSVVTVIAMYVVPVAGYALWRYYSTVVDESGMTGWTIVDEADLHNKAGLEADASSPAELPVILR